MARNYAIQVGDLLNDAGTLADEVVSDIGVAASDRAAAALLKVGAALAERLEVIASEIVPRGALGGRVVDLEDSGDY